MKTLALSVASFGFFAMFVVACGASGNPVSGDDTVNTGVTDAAVIDSAIADSGYGSQDSGVTPTKDSGGVTPIDSGTSLPPDDAGVIFTGAGTCDITDGLTITIEELITFVGKNSPASCDSSTPCDSSHCCLDIASASGGGSLPLGGPTGICLTSLNLSSLGL